MIKTLQSKLSAIALIALVGALAMAAPAAHAQASGKQIPGWLQKEVDKVTAVITDLKDEQKTQLAEAIKVRTEGLAKVKAAKEGGTSEADAKTQSMDVWSDFTRTVKSFLTEAQFEQFKAHMKPKSASASQ
ncbi:hypothetical protein [Prosthecobacter sp.]|uniref:hypothetical protein n=1 Tax=Prosthecobacter sp. TaxID=1965333 RepID=UPI0024892180|nr:hypothetical protein [Prosthecobacter sp.]MDI1315636.1 hypothetical protein [Prosthecobacter sp.]